MAIITLEKMEFHAYHGCLEHEQRIGNTFYVQLSMDLDTSKAGNSDNLDDTLNYLLVYNVVKEQMTIPSKLIEHVAQRIINAVLGSFPQLSFAEVKLTKMFPPLGGKVQSVSITLKQGLES